MYPVDLFEHLWAVDRLQRLGLSRYFEPEIEECVAYVRRYLHICRVRLLFICLFKGIDDDNIKYKKLMDKNIKYPNCPYLGNSVRW